jgi:putative PIN family toxin of toxin-antitoxin system
VKILVDTNILISALLNPQSTPAKTLFHAGENSELVLTDYNIAELHSVTARKFPTRQPDVDVLLAKLTFELIPAPLYPQKLIADPKDAPILNAAILHEVDYIISGDKHFLALDLEHPKAITASEYLRIFEVEA